MSNKNEIWANPDNPDDYEYSDGRMSHSALVRRFLENAAPGAAVELPLDGTLWPGDTVMTDEEVASLVDAIRNVQLNDLAAKNSDWFEGQEITWD